MLAINAKGGHIRQAFSSLRQGCMYDLAGLLLPLPNSLYLRASSDLVTHRACASPLSMSLGIYSHCFSHAEPYLKVSKEV